MAATSDSSVFCEHFYLKFDELVKSKGEDNFFFVKEKYDVNEVKCTRWNKKKQPIEYKRLRRFDVVIVNSVAKLIVPLKADVTQVKYFITNEKCMMPLMRLM